MKQHPSGHNYARVLLELAAARGLQPGTATRVEIYHDTWCEVWRGGYCNCEPEFSFQALRAGDR